MKLVSSFLNVLFGSTGSFWNPVGPDINPASLLPMADGFTDVGGNALGFDNRHGSVGSFGAGSFDTGSDDSCFNAPMDMGSDCSGLTFYSPDIFAD